MRPTRRIRSPTIAVAHRNRKTSISDLAACDINATLYGLRVINMVLPVSNCAARGIGLAMGAVAVKALRMVCTRLQPPDWPNAMGLRP